MTFILIKYSWINLEINKIKEFNYKQLKVLVTIMPTNKS